MPALPVVSPSAVLPAADEERAFELFNRLDNYAGIRRGLRMVAERDSQWAGIPMPLQGRRLVIEPRFPRAKELSDLLMDKDQAKKDAEETERLGFKDVKERNRFWSMTKRAWVVIFQYPDGRIDWGLDRGMHPFDRLMDVMDCSTAWGIEQESRAVQTLGTLVRHHQFKVYLLTGMFMETSKRTGLIYIFRRLRPTIVLDMKHPDGKVRVRCALCQHPIGYYEGTWAGAMCPTDDVIAHLMLMRGDEPMFWRRSNQHPAWAPESGI
jgi:hypothetical protein